MKNRITKKHMAWTWFIGIIISFFFFITVNMTSEEFWSLVKFVVILVGAIIFVMISWKAMVVLTND